MQPFRDIIVIEADKAPEQTASGLYIKEDWKTLPPTGTVKAIGPDVTLVKVGDRVVFERYGAIPYSDTERLCLERHLMGILLDGNS